MESNEPNIVCFICNFVFYQNKDNTPQNVNIVRVNCIGRMDPVLILEVFKKGMDGVMVVGCRPPDCHYIEGNLQAKLAIKMSKKLIALADLEPERIKLLWVSPLEEKNFEYYAEEFSEEIKKLGPSPLGSMKLDSESMANIQAAETAASEFRLRVFLGREKELMDNGNVYGEKISQDKFDELLDEAIKTEYTRSKIYNMLEKESSSVRDLSKRFNLEAKEVLRHITVMRQRGLVGVYRVDGITPMYIALEAE